MLNGYLLNLDLIPYEEAWTLQKQLVAVKKEKDFPDILILLEHPPVFTLGRWGKEKNLRVSPVTLIQEGIPLVRCERGGDITYHGPGQLVAYPILNLKKLNLGVKDYVSRLEEVIIRSLGDFEVLAFRKKGLPGVWVEGHKIASIGIGVQKGVAFHGLAINYAHNQAHFDLITPCGLEGVRMTSLLEVKGQAIKPASLREQVAFHFGEVFDVQLEMITMSEVRMILETGNWKLGEKTESNTPYPESGIHYPPSSSSWNPYLIDSQPATRNPRLINPSLVTPKPFWLKKKIPSGLHKAKVQDLISKGRLHTVCQEACCPNQGECFSKGSATFLLMGDRCTRNCSFCAVSPGTPDPLNQEEPLQVARAIKDLDLSYAVLTSVTRDDLPDGGAGHFVKAVQAIRSFCPGTKIECLIPDFKGFEPALDMLGEAAPEVINHNIETISRLYPLVRPEAGYQRSLTILNYFKQNYPSILTKSGFMVGLGERKAEIRSLLLDLLKQGCEIVTIGQYLQPTPSHLPVRRYVPPEEFKKWEEEALKLGFTAIASWPFVRSSYKAEELYDQAVIKTTER
ncbi:MAG: hypothetical protein C0407_06320 [Desulfobacca sp.]|nr:hypothetical protein [Desulfobacca sp.]